MAAETRILVVDDEEDIRSLCRTVLEEAGYTVRTAGDGQEALDMLAQERADLVLLDIMMPLRNGLSTAEAMQADPALRNIPIVVMSAAGNLQGLAPAVIRLSSALLAKPFDMDRLLEVVERLTGYAAPFFTHGMSSDQSPSLM